MRFLFISLILTLSFQSPSPIDIPCSDKSDFARNIWDMVVFDGQLYVGCGDTRTNAGPIDIRTYTPDAGWHSAFRVDEEQIDKFVVLDGMLAIPGTDSHGESWDFGNWYSLKEGSWVKHRNIPNALHVYDMVDYSGTWFAALGIDSTTQAVGLSQDQGATWNLVTVPVNAVPASEVDFSIPCTVDLYFPASRVYEFFTIDDVLYATGDFPYRVCDEGQLRRDSSPLFMRWNGQEFVATVVDLYPGIVANRVARSILYERNTVYIAASTDVSNHWAGEALFAVNGSMLPRRLTPLSCERPQDIDVADELLYVLCNHRLDSEWRISVQTTSNLVDWDEVANLTSATFARSFAVASDGIYIGLGGDSDASGGVRQVIGQVWLLPKVLLASQ